MQRPAIGRIVWYRSKTGNYTLPAMITATVETLHRPNVEAGHVPDLDSPTHVHLTVNTCGIPGERAADVDPTLGTGPSQPYGGSYPEWNVPYDEMGSTDDTYESVAGGGEDDDRQQAGTWMWPLRVE